MKGIIKTNEKMMNMTRILAQESMMKDMEKSSNRSEERRVGKEC